MFLAKVFILLDTIKYDLLLQREARVEAGAEAGLKDLVELELKVLCTQDICLVQISWRQD